MVTDAAAKNPTILYSRPYLSKCYRISRAYHQPALHHLSLSATNSYALLSAAFNTGPSFVPNLLNWKFFFAFLRRIIPVTGFAVLARYSTLTGADSVGLPPTITFASKRLSACILQILIRLFPKYTQVRLMQSTTGWFRW